MVPHKNEKVNPSFNEICAEWRRYSGTEAIAPESLRGGIARARTRLLANIPSWELPTFLDQLQEATACATAM